MILIGFVIIALIGALVACSVRGRKLRILADVVVGLVGAILAGPILGMFGIGSYGPLGSILIASCGAAALILLARRLKRA